MIRINLLRTTGLHGKAAAFGGSDALTSAVVMNQDKAGGLKLLVLLSFPILLFGYQLINLAALEQTRKDTEAQAIAVEGKKAAYGNAGPRVEKYTKEKQRIDYQLGIIRELTKNRLREVKTLDSLQTLAPPQVWFDTIAIQENLVKAAGYSITDEGLSTLFSALNNSPVFSRFEPKSQSQSTAANGQRTVKFEVEFTIGGKQEQP